MTVPSYSVQRFDLSIARFDTVIDNTLGAPVSAVTVQQVPVGGTATLKLGPGRQEIPLTIQGQTFDVCPAADEALLFNNPITGGILILIIWYADSAQALGT